MSQARYCHGRAVGEAAAEELRKALAFYYGEVEVSRTDAGCDVTVHADVTEPELAEIVRHFLRGHRDVATTVVAQETGLPGLSCVLPEDDRIQVAPGTYLQGPEWTTAMEAVRGRVHDQLAAALGAPLIATSAQIRQDVLVRAGYYQKFPNLVSTVARIRPQYWDGVAVANLRPGQQAARDSFYAPAGVALTPVTCYHVYSNAEMLLGRYDTGLLAVEGPNFRYESHNHGPSRLAEFQMFELVRLGSAVEVATEFQRLLDTFTSFFARLGLPHRIVSASDAFFGDAPTMTREAQLLNRSKFEVRVPLGDGELSVASVNAHGEVFADAFGLRGLGVEATCCAGVGLDRLTYALLSYGLSAQPLAVAGLPGHHR